MTRYRRTLKHYVRDLKKAQLQYAVAIALGIKPVEAEEELAKKKNAVFSDGESTITIFKGELLNYDWMLAGKLIEKERITLINMYVTWQAIFVGPRSNSKEVECLANNPLDAVFKCFVEKKLGKQVIVPIEFE